ncbi:DUF6458 family protein [Yaniella halotolerans]|uniref:DUF6458 family protein n=1 Tax=Yaniella halotolerans TaxID=225453 RepID=UPI0003B65D79|nr:DUF6458 family protein [Yaniella halotolerans]
MKYGGAVALMVIGAILYFAVNVEIQAVNIDMIGLILMVGGVAWLIITVIVDASTRRKRVVPADGRHEIIEE